MNRRFILAVAVFIIFALYFGVRQYRKAGRVELPPLAQEAERTLAPETLHSALSEMLPSPKEISSALDPSCAADFQGLIQVTIGQAQKSVADRNLSLNDDCLSRAPAFLAARWTSAKQACLTNKNDICLSELVAVRVLISHLFWWGRKNFDDMPANVLVAKIWAETIRLGFDSEPLPYADLVTAIDALKAKRSGWAAGQLLIAVALAERFHHETDSDLQAVIGERLSRELEAARSVLPENALPLKIELARAYWGGEDTSSEIESLAARHARSAWALYYLAAVQCRRGEREACLKSLESATHQDSSEPIFQKTLAKIKPQNSDQKKGGSERSIPGAVVSPGDDGDFDLELHFDPWQY